ncbi:hypothetical protein [Streptomyces sp. NPDC090022]|uniref:hypothetical protein n=1 Tax=Streptomyces sp. NPDC090022 TaxID=3365920 RepID=UPI003827C1D7
MPGPGRTVAAGAASGFALRRRHSYATIIVDAETGERIGVLPDREAATTREPWQLRPCS